MPLADNEATEGGGEAVGECPEIVDNPYESNELVLSFESTKAFRFTDDNASVSDAEPLTLFLDDG